MQPYPHSSGPFEALSRTLEAKYLPSLASTVSRGLSHKLDTLTYPLAYALDIEDEETRSTKLSALQSGLHSMAASSGHTVAAVIENLGDVASMLSLGGMMQPGLSAMGLPNPAGGFAKSIAGSMAAPFRASARSHGRMASELLPEDASYADHIIAAAASTPGVIAEAMALAPVLGPAALPAVLANKASRGEGGEFTGAFETAKGAAMGAAMHGANVLINKLPVSRMHKAKDASIAYAGLTALEGGDLKDVVSSAVLGGAMQYGQPKTALDRYVEMNKQPGATQRARTVYNDWYRRREANYGRGAEHGQKPEQLGLGLAEAERDVMKPSHENEMGVRRPGDPDQADTAYRGKPAPAVALPGEPVTAWQVNMGLGAATGKVPSSFDWVRSFYNPKALFGQSTSPDALILTETIRQNGGVDAWVKARTRGRDAKDPVISVERTFQDAENTILELAGLSPKQIIQRHEAGVRLSPEEIVAGDVLLTGSMAEVAQAYSNVKAGRQGSLGELAEAMTHQSAAAYYALGNRSEAGRILNMGKQAHEGRRRAEALKILEKKYGTENLEQIGELMSRLTNPSEVSALIKMHGESASRGWGWDAASIWMAGLLSAPPTWRANIKSNSIFSGLFHGLEGPAAAAFGMAKVPLQKTGQYMANEFYKGGIANVAKDARGQTVFNEKGEPIQVGGAVALERDLAAVPIRNPLTGTKHDVNLQGMLSMDTANRFKFSDVAAEIYGIAKAGPLALDSVRKAWSTSEEFSVQQIRGGVPYDLGRARNRNWWPFRNLIAQDAMFKAAAFNARMYSLGMRDAIKQGVPLQRNGKLVSDRFDHVESFVRDSLLPPEQWTNKQKNTARKNVFDAMERASELTFTRDLERIGKATINLSNVSPAMKPFLTFLTTPANVTKEAWYRIPGLGMVAPKMRQDIMAGGERQGRAFARQAVATSILLGLADKIESGEVTGASPLGMADKEIARSQGFQPFSRLEYDHKGTPRYVSYARDEPLATPIALTATMLDWHKKGRLSADNMDEWATLTSMAMAEIIFNKSIMQSPSKAMVAASDPQRGMKSWVEQMAGSVVPALSNWAARSHDIYRRDQTGLPEAIMARLPGAREKLPVMYDLVGRPYRARAPSPPGLMKSVGDFHTELTPHPVLEAMALSGAQVSRIPRQITMRQEDFASRTDPELVQDALLMRKKMIVDMTPTEREWVNGNANRQAAEQLQPYISRLVPHAKMNPGEFSIEALQRVGADPETLKIMRARGIQSATIYDVMRTEIENTYRQWRRDYRSRIIAKWRDSGKLREELDKKLRQESKLQGYRQELNTRDAWRHDR